MSGWQALHEAGLGHRTGGPPLRRVVGEPVVSRFVMNVVGIEERNEQVDIEERRRHG